MVLFHIDGTVLAPFLSANYFCLEYFGLTFNENRVEKTGDLCSGYCAVAARSLYN